jgi:regulator of protease activity HflC (stomatin/prohibitin superfamily)
MNKKLIIILVFILFISLIFYNNLKVIQQYEIPIIIKVTKNVGIIIDTDKLYYGVNPGGYATRSILLQNNYSKNVIIDVKTKKLSSWINIQNEKFILKSNQTKKIDIIINPPSSTRIGEYNSTLIVTIKAI